MPILLGLTQFNANKLKKIGDQKWLPPATRHLTQSANFGGCQTAKVQTSATAATTIVGSGCCDDLRIVSYIGGGDDLRITGSTGPAATWHKSATTTATAVRNWPPPYKLF